MPKEEDSEQQENAGSNTLPSPQGRALQKPRLERNKKGWIKTVGLFLTVLLFFYSPQV